jgi:uncharacterized phage-associated protein
MEHTALAGYDTRKAAQIAAFFASKQPGVEKLKLIKLIYLSERESLTRFGLPMIFDELYSLKDGPICSAALNAINGEMDADYWSQFVSLKDRYVSPVRTFSRDDFDEVSDAEVDVLEDLWKQFGQMTASQIRNWTHKNCPEYTEVEKGRVPIDPKEILALVDADGADERMEEIRHLRRAASIFSS